MATPHVAGVAGLLWMYFPECKNYQIRNVLAATAEDLGDGGCDTKYGHGLVQAKKAYELLSQGNCGGNLGKVFPAKGGCEQSVPDGPTAAPTPECASDQDCDDGDTCTVDTCDNGLCLSTPECALCGKTKVEVEITIDNYGDETTYDIKDASDNTVMQGSGWPANTVNSFWQCFSSGSYTFTITDTYGDGICCSYGNGGYSVKVNGKEVASGGEFGSKEEKSFDVASSAPTPQSPAPTTSAPIAPPTSPTPGPSTTAPNPAPNNTPPTPFPTVSMFPPPTMYPTYTPPTMHPTHSPPTMHPTASVPTPFPTESPPTSYPTENAPTAKPTIACKAKDESCTKHADCCNLKCNLKKKFCRK